MLFKATLESGSAAAVDGPTGTLDSGNLNLDSAIGGARRRIESDRETSKGVAAVVARAIGSDVSTALKRDSATGAGSRAGSDIRTRFGNMNACSIGTLA